MDSNDVYQMRLAGARGILIDDWADYEVGDSFEIDGEAYLIVNKESLSRYTDGVYNGRPAWIQLRGWPNV